MSNVLVVCYLYRKDEPSEHVVTASDAQSTEGN
jgi:hypothetical protein